MVVAVQRRFPVYLRGQVQLEDKLVDGIEAAHEESRKREDIESHGDETLPESQVEAVPGAGLDKRGELLGVVRMILAGDDVVISALGFPQLESRALETLQVVTSARTRMGHFVYASDRRDMLERALTVLQPSMGQADIKTAR